MPTGAVITSKAGGNKGNILDLLKARHLEKRYGGESQISEVGEWGYFSAGAGVSELREELLWGWYLCL